MNSDEFGQVLRREREPGAVVKVRYCRPDPRGNSTPSTLLFTAKPKFGQKCGIFGICWLMALDMLVFFVEMPQLNTATLEPIMQSCPSAIMLVLLTAFTNQRVFLKTGSPYFRNWPFTVMGSLMIHYWYIRNLLKNLTHLHPNLDKDSVFRGHKMHPRVFQEPLCENA